MIHCCHFLAMLFLCHALTTWNYSTSRRGDLGISSTYKITPTYVDSYARAGLHNVRYTDRHLARILILIQLFANIALLQGYISVA